MITTRRRQAIAGLVLALAATGLVATSGAESRDGFISSPLWPFSTPSWATNGAAAAAADTNPSRGRHSARFDRFREQAFKVFARLYNKSYSPEELPRRMKLFFERRKEIEASARAYAEGKLSFMMRENAYVDWDERELKTLTGVAPPKRPDEFTPEDRQALLSAARRLRRQRRSVTEGKSGVSSSVALDYDLRGGHTLADLARHSEQREGEEAELEFEQSANATNIDDDDEDDDEDEDPDLVVRAPVQIPTTKDWRESGCVATPMHQYRCGACYAIATMGTLETMRCLNRVSSPTLSPQQVVDCSRAYNNFGCNGGWPTRVLKYLQDTGVAAREACYPFVRRQLTCRLRQVQAMGAGCTVSSSPTDSRLTYRVLNNERDILYHVASTGPVVTVMRATDKFLYYGSGIFDDATCSRRRDDVDHAIVIVGYGRRNGQDYWLIKNSWGESWGQRGYGLYKRGTNACSIGHWGWVITS